MDISFPSSLGSLKSGALSPSFNCAMPSNYSIFNILVKTSPQSDGIFKIMCAQVNVSQLKYRLAKTEDGEAVIALVNSVYRGDSAKDLWTTESELVDGPRIDGKAYKEIIGKKGSHLILALAGKEII